MVPKYWVRFIRPVVNLDDFPRAPRASLQKYAGRKWNADNWGTLLFRKDGTVEELPFVDGGEQNG